MVSVQRPSPASSWSRSPVLHSGHRLDTSASWVCSGTGLAAAPHNPAVTPPSRACWHPLSAEQHGVCPAPGQLLVQVARLALGAQVGTSAYWVYSGTGLAAAPQDPRSQC